MKQVQEISDGLTKPVEKPIPKPLPPTVHLNTNNVTTAKRPLEEKLKQLQPLNGSHKTNTTHTGYNSSYHNKKFKSFSNNTNHTNYSNPYRHSNSSNSGYATTIPTNPYLDPSINQKFFFNSNNYHITQNTMKIEPTDTAYVPQSFSYFTNPVEFKQEPIEYPTTSTDYSEQQQNVHYQQAEQQSTSNNLVNHLLKDKQVLNLLDKVAQTFRPPTQSMYQVSLRLFPS
jgi:hypothetical protein